MFRNTCTISAMPTLGERMSVSEALQSLLLEMGQQRALDGVLRVVVDRLAAEEHIALARIWLLRPGDICTTCPMREECPDQTRCLHLVSSAGRSRAEGADPWTRIDGDFRRMPIGVRKVGRVAAIRPTLRAPDGIRLKSPSIRVQGSAPTLRERPALATR